jgi:DNA-binding response OmpR family regulator
MSTNNNHSILAIDDTDIILELLEEQLTNEGYNVTTCSKGNDAKTLINDVKFDLILLDIEMPEITGIELLKHIKSTDTNKSTAVIMITAQNDADHVKECLTGGARDYILKPFNMVSVKQRIWRVLNS